MDDAEIRQGPGNRESSSENGDILIDTNLSVDLDGRPVQIMTFGFGQTPGDLYVWDATAKTLWTGNVIVCPEPGIPWLLDGRHAEVLNTLKKIRDFLPDDAIIVPGHYKPIRKSEIDFSINYLQALHDGVKMGIDQHQTLEQIVASLKMEEFNKGYPIWNWLQFQVNIPNTYKDLKTGSAVYRCWILHAGGCSYCARGAHDGIPCGSLE